MNKLHQIGLFSALSGRVNNDLHRSSVWQQSEIFFIALDKSKLIQKRVGLI